MSRGRDPVFAPWQALASLTDGNFAESATATVIRLAQAEDEPCNPLVLNALRKASLNSMHDVARVYGELLTATHADWKKCQETHAEVTSFDEPAMELGQGAGVNKRTTMPWTNPKSTPNRPRINPGSIPRPHIVILQCYNAIIQIYIIRAIQQRR